ncbi:MAG: PEP-utilizing enzyme [bacterium]|nr:PEP-utilizing enzyme [bacterium]
MKTSNLSKKILQNLDHNVSEYIVRDIGLLSATFLNKSLAKDIALHFWFIKKNNQAIVYRSGQDYLLWSKLLGKKCLASNSFLKKNIKDLIHLTDEINKFIKVNKKLDDLVIKWLDFYKMYLNFMFLHMAVAWASIYLLSIKKNYKDKKKINKIIKQLDKAYIYNEKLIPNIEFYFKKLNISHLTCDEMPKLPKVSKYRSVLQLGSKSIILKYNEAAKINKVIQEDYENFLRNKKYISGLAVSKGIATGKVRVVKDFREFKNLKKGDILVTYQTRPHYNQYIKKVAAIVTDEGSLLGHSSIIAREFCIPCIVGVKNAVLNLKSGDLVEVDANKGIVKKIDKDVVKMIGGDSKVDPVEIEKPKEE